jgi:subtilase family serine protease
MPFRSLGRFRVAAVVFPVLLQAQTGSRAARPLITGAVDVAKTHRLAGNTRPEANAVNDLGPAPADLAMEHMLLLLKRSPERELALARYIDELHDPRSSNYHKWLSAAQISQDYGAAEQDIDTVSAWLRSQGLTVNFVYPNQVMIDCSGTADTVARAFHTSVHRIAVRGENHIANMNDPEIPEALAPAVAGIASLHDFRPRAANKPRSAAPLPRYTFSGAGAGADVEIVTPGDLATIYNFNPLFAAGLTGKGQTIALVEDADLYTPDDWNAFRGTFGLARYTSGSLAVIHPAANGQTCTPAGISSGDDLEATLDAEWASAAAPDAAIQVASCANTRTTFGGLIALENLVNSDTPPDIISISYGQCEAVNGAALNETIRAAYQQAVARGISIFAAAGDEGAAACDAGSQGAMHGISVSGWASTPYNVAAGGTDFADTYSQANSTYWSSANLDNYASALSYIPETAWNDSCAGAMLASSLGFGAGYGDDGLCASSSALVRGLLQVVAGGGGPSGCASGVPEASGVVGGSCQGFPKPGWQTGLPGIPADGVRDIPDVSVFSGTGTWGHYYVICYSNARNGGGTCAAEPGGWIGAGGTSFSAPILAGLQALVNQKTGGLQGNPNFVYYRLAAVSGALCDSSAGDHAASACIFHNVTLGDIAVNCGGAQNCYGSSASGSRRGPLPNGALSQSADSYRPAFASAAGWNFAAGLGSINAANLVNNWR